MLQSIRHRYLCSRSQFHITIYKRNCRGIIFLPKTSLTSLYDYLVPELGTSIHSTLRCTAVKPTDYLMKFPATMRYQQSGLQVLGYLWLRACQALSNDVCELGCDLQRGCCWPREARTRISGFGLCCPKIRRLRMQQHPLQLTQISLLCPVLLLGVSLHCNTPATTIKTDMHTESESTLSLPLTH